MEKQQFSAKFKQSRRLLIVILILFAQNLIFSQVLNSRIIRNLKIVPQTENLFTETDILFTLEIPYAQISDIYYDIQTTPEKVHFKSSRQTKIYNQKDGVLIELWFSFDENGTYNLPPMILKYNNRTFYIPFNSVKIQTSPKKILPQLVIEFEDGKQIILNKNKFLKADKIVLNSGKVSNFSVYVKNALQVMSFEYKISKNSILSEVEKVQEFKENFSENKLSFESIPIGKFSIIPLEKGNQLFPEFSVSVVSYSGQRQTILISDFYYDTISENLKSDLKENPEQKFPYAFVELSEDAEKISKKKITKEDCIKIAELRTNEKKSNFFLKDRKIRKDFEKSLGLTNTKNENYSIIFLTCSIFSVFLLIFSVFFAIRKKKVFSVSFLFLCFAFSIFSLYYRIDLNRESAVIFDGKLRNVPEKSVDAITSVENGQKVMILQSAGNWLFVEFENISGWTTKENVVFIE